MQNKTLVPHKEAPRPYKIPCRATNGTIWEGCEIQLLMKFKDRRQISSKTGRHLLIMGSKKLCVRYGNLQTVLRPFLHALHKPSIASLVNNQSSQPYKLVQYARNNLQRTKGSRDLKKHNVLFVCDVKSDFRKAMSSISARLEDIMWPKCLNERTYSIGLPSIVKLLRWSLSKW